MVINTQGQFHPFARRFKLSMRALFFPHRMRSTSGFEDNPKDQHCTIILCLFREQLWLASVGVLCLFEEDRKGVAMI